MEQIEKACHGIRAVVKDKQVAEGLVVEACLTAAFFENVTKIVDGTMRKRKPSFYLVVLTAVNYIGRTVWRMMPSFLTQ